MLLLMLGVSYYRDWYGKGIEILTGPAGASSWRKADDIETAILNATPAPLLRYQVTQRETQGFDHIQRLLAKDTSGTKIGFGMEATNHDEGFGQATVLVPLDWDYLHILCRRQLIVDLEEYLEVKIDPETPLRLGRVLSWIEEAESRRKNKTGASNKSEGEARRTAAETPQVFGTVGRMYVGPQLSGTRRFAEWVLDHYGLDVDDCAATGIGDWNEACVQTKQGELDFLFFSGPLGAGTVDGLTSESVLLSIDDICDAVAKQNEMRVSPAEFPQNSYRASTTFSDGLARSEASNAPSEPADATEMTNESSGSESGEGESSNKDAAKALRFCPAGTKTISTRRVLLCSPQMSAFDAYQIAKAVKETLPATISESWRSAPPNSAADVRPSGELVLPIHPGALPLKRGEPLRTLFDPWTWPAWCQTLAATFLFAFLSGMIAPRQAKLASVAVGDGEKEGIATWDSHVDKLEEIVKHSREIDLVRNYDKWTHELEHYRQELEGFFKSQKMLEKDYEVRLAQLHYIKIDIDSPKPPRHHPKKPTGNAKSLPSARSSAGVAIKKPVKANPKKRT
ncbi:MAG: hypothetical protein B7Z55_03950 [Planctomycetales bacterium 12-60-4]|nr:MAG: hypothetical protein B7Z55_03950 [Planctomycetales bacterium 12-60-4]